MSKKLLNIPQNTTSNTTNNTSNTTVNADKVIILKNDGGFFNNGGFITAFSDPLFEIAQNKDLTKLDLRFLFLILSYMGDKEMMISANRQRLLPLLVYGKELGLPKNKSHVSESFMRLEEMGYFKRDKGRKELEIMINPAIAYNGKTREFTQVWNQSALDFGNKPRKIEERSGEEESQEWGGHLIEDIAKKRKTMKQINIDGGIDDVEY